MIEGATSKPFSLKTDAINIQRFPYKEQIIQHSKEKFGRKKEVIEQVFTLVW